MIYKVLIVDDELYIRKGMYEIIDWDEYGFRIVGDAGDGKEAIGLIRMNFPQLIIADINMPEMDGLTLIRELNNLKINIKTVFLTACKDFEYAKEAIRQKAKGFLNKPIDERELSDLLLEIKQELDNENELDGVLAKSEYSSAVVTRAVNMIKNHYNKNITLKSISDELFVNPSYLGQQFRKITGANFNDYLSNIRIKQAKKLLVATDLKIYEIAERVGFTDVQYFYKVYKKITMQSPREMREKDRDIASPE